MQIFLGKSLVVSALLLYYIHNMTMYPTPPYSAVQKGSTDKKV